MVDFAERELGGAALDVALEEFFLWDMRAEEESPLAEGVQQVFLPWMLFSWRLEEGDLEDLEVDLTLPPGASIAELFVQRKGRKLDHRKRQILAAVGRLAFTFCEILDARCGIERVFGTWKRIYGLARARHVGLKKVEAELYLVGMAFNLKKEVLMMRG